MTTPYLYIRGKYRTWAIKNYQKTLDAKKLRALHNIHKGERCVIVANGPSLTPSDLDAISEAGLVSFAMNRIFKIFPQTKWRPTYYVCEDINVFKDSVEQINLITAKRKFIPKEIDWFHGIKIKKANNFWINYDEKKRYPLSFSPEIDKQIDGAGTVTHTCIVIAAYMGFEEIYLLGVDNNYYKSIDENGNEVIDENAKDHFCKDYNEGIEDIAVHNIGNNTRSYKNAKTYCDENGIKIYNATRGGKLEVYPRVDLDELLNTVCQEKK